MADKKLQTVDSIILAGVKERMTKQFRCPVAYVTGPDKLRELQITLGNKTPVYPYLFLTIQNRAHGTDTYSSHRLARYGVPVQISTDERQMEYARIIPTNFEIEVTFITNKYDGNATATDWFSNRWLFSRRNGFLQFRVSYGLTELDIATIMNETVTVPMRESPTDQESVYQVTTNMMVKGYVSEPVLGKRQRILEVDAKVAAVSQGTQAPQYFPFT